LSRFWRRHAPEGPAGPRYLFVTGCPRSGTTALAELVAAHPNVMIGIERYGLRFARREFLDRSLFERERFFDLRPGDTFYPDLDAFWPQYAQMRERFEGALYRGDKIPFLYRRMKRLLDTFGAEVRVLFIFRNIFDVAASYNARADDAEDATWKSGRTPEAVRDWAEAVEVAAGYAHNPGIYLVQYEALFQAARGLKELLDFMQLPAEPVAERYQRLLARARQLEEQRRRNLSYADLDHILRRAPIEAYRSLLGRFGVTL
jgi:hypothetical protein